MSKTSRFHRYLPIAGLALAGALFAGGALLTPSPAQAADAACTSKKFEFKAVEKACKEGGQKAAKKLMKNVVKGVRSEGGDMDCKGCHKSLKTYERKANAGKDLKKYEKYLK